MTALFRNDSPGALTRQQAVALMKKRMKERARQARELAAAGRGEDTEIAHVALGEFVVPEALQTPEVLDVLRRAAASQNIPFNRLRVGSRANSINPNTGAPEFGYAWADDPWANPQGIQGIDVTASRYPEADYFSADRSNDYGGAEGPGGSAPEPAAPQQPYLVPGPPTQNVTVRALRGPSLAPISPRPANRLRDATNPPQSGGDYIPRTDDVLPGGDTVSGNLDRTLQDLKTWRKAMQMPGPGLGLAGPALGTAGAIEQWINRVRPGGAWDYKMQTPGRDAKGNFNYGATGSVFFPEEVLLRAGGAAQMLLQSGYDSKNGRPWGDWPYGDDPNDSRNISAGYTYGRSIGPKR